MSQKDGMSISELIRSSAKVRDKKNSDTGYGARQSLRGKRFGTIYAFNKKVKVKPESSVVEISMMIEASTEKKADKTKGYHKVMLAIAGVDQQEVTADELVALIRFERVIYADEEKYDKDTLIKMALNQNGDQYKTSKEAQENTILPNRSVFESDTSGKYVIVSNQIKDSAKVQVWCSCSSYYWVFQYYNIKAGVNIKSRNTMKSIGAYKYRTQKGFEAFNSGRPMRNPEQAPGLCKHLMLLLGMLMEQGTVERNSKAARDVYDTINFDRLKYNERISDAQYNNIMRNFDKDMNVLNNERKFNSMNGEAAWSQRNSSTNPYVKKGFT